MCSPVPINITGLFVAATLKINKDARHVKFHICFEMLNLMYSFFSVKVF